ncbi:MAG: hypothetical protein ABI614_03730 [Planctomycetota bacterium]
MRKQPALREQVAQEMGECFKTLSLAGVFRPYHMIEREMPVVMLVISFVGEPKYSALVLL